MAEVFDFAKGKAAFEAKKAQQNNMESDMPPLSSEDISDLFSLTETEASKLLEENLTEVFNKIMEHAKTVDNFTEEEAHRILNKHFEDLFAHVFMRASRKGNSKDQVVQKLNQIVNRHPSLRLVKNTPDSKGPLTPPDTK